MVLDITPKRTLVLTYKQPFLLRIKDHRREIYLDIKRSAIKGVKAQTNMLEVRLTGGRKVILEGIVEPDSIAQMIEIVLFTRRLPFSDN